MIFLFIFGKSQVLVFAADLLERWTHGAVCSCRHRVRAPGPAGRLSLVYVSWSLKLSRLPGCLQKFPWNYHQQIVISATARQASWIGCGVCPWRSFLKVGYKSVSWMDVSFPVTFFHPSGGHWIWMSSKSWIWSTHPLGVLGCLRHHLPEICWSNTQTQRSCLKDFGDCICHFDRWHLELSSSIDCVTSYVCFQVLSHFGI